MRTSYRSPSIRPEHFPRRLGRNSDILPHDFACLFCSTLLPWKGPSPATIVI